MNSSPTHVSFRPAVKKGLPPRQQDASVSAITPSLDQEMYHKLAIWAILRDNGREGGLDVVEAMVCT